MAEFGQTNPITSIVRFIASILTGVPSIVVSVFAYGLIVLLTKGFSAIAGGFALAVKRKVLLMDEPCSALDPIATMKVEELLHSIKKLTPHYP